MKGTLNWSNLTFFQIIFIGVILSTTFVTAYRVVGINLEMEDIEYECECVEWECTNYVSGKEYCIHKFRFQERVECFENIKWIVNDVGFRDLFCIEPICAREKCEVYRDIQ